jgi:ribosomal protein S18 acetylase RimI-like enzyme
MSDIPDHALHSVHLRVIPFEQRWGPTILTWVQSSEELCYWTARQDHPLTDAAIFETWHSDPDTSAHVLMIGDDEPVGYGEVWRNRDDDSVELGRLIISPGYRRRKFGRYLIEELINLRDVKSLQLIWVRLLPSNIPAAICYESAGFARCSLKEERELNTLQRFQFIWMSLRRQANR